PALVDFGRRIGFLAAALFLFFISGAGALIYEVLWVRLLLLLLGTSTGAVSAVLGIFMFGLGLGARIFGPRADRCRSPLKLYAYLEIGVGLYAMLLPRLVAGSAALYVDLVRHVGDRP